MLFFLWKKKVEIKIAAEKVLISCKLRSKKLKQANEMWDLCCCKQQFVCLFVCEIREFALKCFDIFLTIARSRQLEHKQTEMFVYPSLMGLV